MPAQALTTKEQQQLEEAQFLLTEHMPTLQHLAHRATHVHQKTNREVVVYCIAVNSQWRHWAVMLNPEMAKTWNEEVAADKQPIALGLATRDFAVRLAEKYPDNIHDFMKEPDGNKMKCIALTDTGIKIIFIDPFPAG